MAKHAMNAISEKVASIVTSVGQVPAERLRTIFDGMFDGVWLVSGDGSTTYANAAMADLLGTTPAEMRGRGITEYMDPENWEDTTSFLDRQRDHAGERKELCFRRADGSELFGFVAAARSRRRRASSSGRC